MIPSFFPRLIPYLVSEPLADVLKEPFVASVVPPLMARHRRSIDILRQRSECKDGTIYFDISDQDLEGYNKFIPYYLHRDSVYSVGLSSSSFRVKVSVGSNPWTDRQNMVNLAKICERYGGGGHARVGAISFLPIKAIWRAQQRRKLWLSFAPLKRLWSNNLSCAKKPSVFSSQTLAFRIKIAT